MMLPKPINIYMNRSSANVRCVVFVFLLLLSKIADVVRVINGCIFVRIILAVVIEKIFTVH